MAIVAMTVDHFGKTVYPLDAMPFHLVGRVAFPLFALVMAQRLARKPGRAPGLIGRLLVAAVLAQPAFVAVGGSGLNVLFAWAGGCVLVWFGSAMAQDLAASRHLSWRSGLLVPTAAAVMVGLVVAAPPWQSAGWSGLEFGPAGVLIVPVLVILWCHLPAAAPIVAALLALAANLPVVGVPLTPVVLALGVALVVSQGTVLAAVKGYRVRLPRLPRLSFYAFYPGHLYLLSGLAIVF